MRLSLGTKILGSFGIIVFLALGLTVGAGNRFTRSEYKEFAIQRDLNQARAMAPLFGEWTHKAAEARKDGLQPSLSGYPLFMQEDGGRQEDWEREDWDEDHNDGDRFRHRRGHIPPNMVPDSPISSVFDKLLITDIRGQVLFNTTGLRERQYLFKEGQPMGIAVHNNREIVGYLYVGRMLPNPSRSSEFSFFRDAGSRTLIFTALVFLAAIFLGLLLTRHIVIPVKTLNSATHRVEKGVLTVRIPDNRQDEMGDLARGFNAMTAALEAADNHRRQLIADSAHELRTPVSLIRTRIEMMEEGIYPLDAKGLTALAEETDRLVSLIEELKTLASLESNNFSMETASVNLASLISGVIESSKPAIMQSKISVEMEINDTRPMVLGNATRLHRLMKNLLSNALQYADNHIHISVAPHLSKNIEIWIEDDGPGIPETKRERVFERFYRVDASRSRKSGGTGLGLAICREIVKAHDGEIRADISRKLGGAAFRILLPREHQS